MMKTKHINIGKFELILFCNEDWTIELPVFGTISYGEALIGDSLNWFLETKIKNQIKAHSFDSEVCNILIFTSEEKEDYRKLIKELRKEVGYERPRTDD